MSQPAKPSPLGRGLSALFGDADTSYQAPPKQSVARATPPQPINAQPTPLSTAPTPVKQGHPHTLPLSWLQPGVNQPRRNFNAEQLNGLADSIRERGIIEPLIIRPMPGLTNAYEIVAGERRWRAAQLAMLHEVPVVVRDMSDREALEFGLIENIQRQDLTPIEEGEGYRRLLDEFNYTQDDLAKIVGKSRPHITNFIRLLTLPDSVKQMLNDGIITYGHARAIVPTRDPAAIAKEIVARGLNVRQTEALAKLHMDNPEIHIAVAKRREAITADAIALERDIERVIGMKVRIAPKGKGGSLTVTYHSLDQMDALIQKLKSE